MYCFFESYALILILRFDTVIVEEKSWLFIFLLLRSILILFRTFLIFYNRLVFAFRATTKISLTTILILILISKLENLPNIFCGGISFGIVLLFIIRTFFTKKPVLRMLFTVWFSCWWHGPKSIWCYILLHIFMWHFCILFKLFTDFIKSWNINVFLFMINKSILLIPLVILTEVNTWTWLFIFFINCL